MSNRWQSWTTLAVALGLLDVSLTFHNIWPTPAIRWQGELSIELAVCILILVAARRWLGQSHTVLRGLTALWILLVIGRYADVTAQALFGRDINLYWDLRYIPDVTALLARATPPWLVVAIGLATLLLLGLLYGTLRWAWGRVAALTDAGERRALVVLAATFVMLFVSLQLGVRLPSAIAFSVPVTSTYARQVRFVADALTGSRAIAPSPAISSNLARVKGADVFLIFLESYGAASYDRPEFAARLAEGRARFEEAIHSTNRGIVSAYVESPTFGGSSWFAHISLMSGIEVREPHTNALLMTQKRDTLVTAFARHGYRTVALMPGLWQSWPEGSFYGFDEIYDGARLGYRGPKFGWFGIPDQFAIAWLDALETERPSKAPLFAFFPTISTHTPFSPTPPYQPDWARMLTNDPYDAADVDRAFARETNWLDLGPSYVDAVSYAYTTLAGYLRARADRDFVMILIGDHQPPALVSGEGAPWDVPVHVITGRRQLLERLPAHGFAPGLRPHRPVIGRMHELLRVLLDAFGDRESATGGGP